MQKPAPTGTPQSRSLPILVNRTPGSWRSGTVLALAVIARALGVSETPGVPIIEVDTAGDSDFRSPGGAVQAAVMAQRALKAHDWPAGSPPGV